MTLRRAGALLVYALVLASCAATATDASDGSSAPEDVDSQGLVVFQGTGEAVEGVTVIPLVGSPDFDDSNGSFAVDPNTEPTETDNNGGFSLSYSVTPQVAGVEVVFDVPALSGDSAGRFGWREVVDPTGNGQRVEIPNPQPCNASAQVCGQPLLPDLTPIISADDLDPSVAERLEIPDQAPPTAGLFPASTWFVEQIDGRRLLRFATVAANVGDGPLDIIAGSPNSDADTAATIQRIWTDTWTFNDVASGEFVVHPTHDHIHFDAFEQYRLLDDTGAVVASSEKVSFCLRDSVRVSSEAPAPTGVVFAAANGDCGDQQQVINPGFGDHYHSLLDDQWIDVTNVPLGRYVLEITIDPLDLIVESDETNNTGSFTLVIE